MPILKTQLPVTKIENIQEKGKNVCQIVQVSLEGVDFDYIPGQWANIGMEGFKHRAHPEKIYMSAFSICTSPAQKGVLEFLVGVHPTGGLTEHMEKNLTEGDLLWVQGPFGHFTFNEERKKQVWVATGTGIAPFMSFIRTIGTRKLNGFDIQLYYGCRNPETLYYGKELAGYAETLPSFRLVETLSDENIGEEWKGEKGWVTPLVERHFTEHPETDIEAYVCGIPAMVEDVVGLFQKAGIPEAQIRREKYS